MISRIHRLTKSQVAVVKSQGLSLKTHFFTLVYSPSHDQNTHFAVVVSKKISPKAVTRNVLRRRFYTVAGNFTQKPLSILIIPHQHILKQNTSTTMTDLNQQLSALCSKL